MEGVAGLLGVLLLDPLELLEPPVGEGGVKVVEGVAGLLGVLLLDPLELLEPPDLEPLDLRNACTKAPSAVPSDYCCWACRTLGLASGTLAEVLGHVAKVLAPAAAGGRIARPPPR